jgi:glycine betaine/proline transport system substrate-binding protein
MVSKDAVDNYGIKSLDDFKREDVKKALGKDKDEKVDLISCETGWQCVEIVTHHLKIYGLEDHINPITATYEAGMASAIGVFKSGEPILFYNWAPNRTIFKLKPGKCVMWINVAEIIPAESQRASVDRMTISGVEGAVTDPIKMGFITADVRIVANKKFLKKNPAIRKFFEIFKLNAADINAQNAKMNDGEKSDKDISRHAEEWIKAHQDTWDKWLDKASATAK